MSSDVLHKLPIKERPKASKLMALHGAAFLLLFNLACLLSNLAQFVFLLPLRILPFNWARRGYEEGVRYTKGGFAMLCILMCQLFAPTKMAISFERKGKGAFSEADISEIIQRDAQGHVVALKLPTKLVMIANHQIYADWWYLWCLAYYMGTHRDVLIVLKKSLKWIPVLGWGMQFFDFIFLARSWASDRVYLAKKLAELGRRAERADEPLELMIFPEGTLISEHTRPVSQKYAEKIGVPDTRNVLLPRSTGLQYSLRSLYPRMQGLKLLDITVAYDGIPHMGYGQSYYTLRSIFCNRVPPPIIHYHLRLFDVATDVPIGSSAIPAVNNGSDEEKHVEVPESERVTFETWLRDLWRDKDEHLDAYHKSGAFVSTCDAEIPVRLRRTREIFEALSVGPTLAIIWLVRKLR